MIHSEELLCDVADVVAVTGRKVSATVAKNAMAVILNNIKTYPRHIQVQTRLYSPWKVGIGGPGAVRL